MQRRNRNRGRFDLARARRQGRAHPCSAQKSGEGWGESPLFDWAIGWLAREDKIAITPEKRSFRVQLKDSQTKAASG